AATEKAATEKAAAEKVAAQNAAAEKATTEKAAAEKVAAEKAATEKAVAEKTAAEKVATEKAATEKAAADKAAAEASSFDEEMAEIFIEEAREVLERTDTILHHWRSDLENEKTVNSLKREIHTLKGSSLMAGMPSVGGLSHVMETLLEKISEKRLTVTESIVAGLEVGCDNIHTMVESLSKGNMPSDKDLNGYISAIEQLEKTSVKPKTITIEKPAKEPVEPKKPEAPRALVIPTLPEQPRTIQVMPENIESNETQEGTVRVNATLLNDLINFAGEISIYRSRLDQEIGGFRNNLTEVHQTITRLRDQLRKMDIETETQILSRFQRETDYSETEFDPLELDRFSTIQQLSRALAESVADLTSLEEDLDNTARISETLLLQQSRVNTEMHEGLMQTRMVHFGTIAPRLRRLVRQAAKDTQKKAGLKLQLAGNSEGMLDRDVLEKITAPLEHIIRNAIAHGIETPAQRKKLKKTAEGKITITVESEATELLITVEDDGSGINLEQIRQQAIKRGMLKKSEQVSDSRLLEFIMESGFTTAEKLSDIAGRGIGMDVVNNEIKVVGGSLDVHTEKNKGSRFRLRIPFTLAVMQAINITAGERDYAIPLASVRGVTKLSPDNYRQLLDNDKPSYDFAGESYHLFELEHVLGFATTPVENENIALLMIRAGNLRAAFRVNNLKSHHEVVIKPVGQQVASIPGILGGTITGDGEVLIVLDMGPLIRLGIAQASQSTDDIIEVVPEVEEKRAPLILVVDDSITMRKITSRVLENAAMEVFTAKDGLDAIDQMMERTPDLIVLDIEMPRMDGYELATYVRADVRLRDMPLIMITSRSGQKHRDRAAKIGVDRYMAKPYQESEMVSNVTELLEQKKELNHDA
ncbi:MAG: response regulator, partial [Xanthomonadales bacterium]|nr:response regulator [Xanthomonadales bacterium]